MSRTILFQKCKKKIDCDTIYMVINLQHKLCLEFGTHIQECMRSVDVKTSESIALFQKVTLAEGL